MNSRANVLIWKNKLRLFKGTIRHSWQALIGLIAVAGILLYQLLFALMSIERGIPVVSQYVIYVLAAVAAINFMRVFLSSTPVFKMNAATLLYIYNTRYFTKVLRRKQALSLLSSSAVAFSIAFCLRGFIIDESFPQIFLLLLTYIGGCSLMAWIFYHGKRTERIAVLLMFVVMTVLFLLQRTISIIILTGGLLALEIYVWKSLQLNIPKYYERLQFIDITAAAQSQNDFAKMQQLAEENRPQFVHGLTLEHLHPSKRSALTMKSVIELIRMQKQILVMLLLLLLAGWVISRTDLLAFLPLFENSSVKDMLAAFCTTTSLSALYQILAKQVKTVSEKRLLGLALPFSKGQIFLRYLPIALFLNLLIAFIIGIVYVRLSFVSLAFWVVANVVYIVQCFSCVYETKAKQVLTVIANLLLWAGAYWYLVL